MDGVIKGEVQSASRFAEAIGKNLAKILLELARYIDEYSKYAPYKEMAAWIRNNKGENCVSIYPVQGDCANELKYLMDKERIPYIDLGDENGILVKNPDYDRTRELNRGILIARGNYYQDVDINEMENDIARFGKIKDKNILTIKCSDFIEAEVLKNKCNNISKGFMVGMSKPDENGNINLAVHGSKVYSDNPKKQDFCKSYLQMTLSLYGPNGSLKEAQVIHDEEMDIKIAEMKDSKSVSYLIGENDTSRFIEFNAKGFEYYETTLDEDGMRHDNLVTMCAKNSPNYESELQRCTDMIFNKTFVNSTQDLAEHLKTKKRNYKSDRTNKNLEQYKISLAQNRMADKINEMIKERVAQENLIFPDAKMQFLYYQNEASTILEAAGQEKAIPGYNKEDIQELSEMAKEANLDINLDYRASMETLREQETDIHKAKRHTRTEVREDRKQYNNKDLNKKKEKEQDNSEEKERIR